MNAAMRQVAEINRVTEAIQNTKSPYLMRDYEKNLRRLKKELREYCYYRGFNFKQILGE